MIICKRHVDHDDHLQEASWSGWSYARGRSIGMIICMRPVYQEDHLQEAGPSGWPFARGQSIRMIICKRPVDMDDHLQEVVPSWRSFTKSWSIQINHLLLLVLVCRLLLSVVCQKSLRLLWFLLWIIVCSLGSIVLVQSRTRSCEKAWDGKEQSR